MTKDFKELSDYLNDNSSLGIPELCLNGKSERIEAVCLYQIASSMVEIDKDLKNIATKLEKISGRI